MPNICLTDYAVTGPLAQLAELNDILATAEDKYRHGQVRDLRSQLDDADNYWRPAEWSDRRLTDDTLRFSTESPWAMPSEFTDALTRRYPELRVYWRYEICEEGENGTNDSEGRYFATGWNLEIEDCGITTYPNLDALSTAICLLTGERPAPTAEACEEVITAWNDTHPVGPFAAMNPCTLMDE